MKPVRLILADPAWPLEDPLPGKGRGASKHYKCMTIDEIAAFSIPISIPVAFDCLLMLWRLSALQEEALHVARAWGFTPKSELVWQKLTKNGKDHFGMGRYVRASHETCLICVRGKIAVDDRSVRSTFKARFGRHSEKPDEIYNIAKRLVRKGPHLELFARKKRDGWLQLGNELEQSAPEPELVKLSQAVPAKQRARVQRRGAAA